MIFVKSLKLLIGIFLLIDCINKVKSVKEDYECTDFIGTDHAPTKEKTKPKKDYKGRPRPDQKSLLIVFDATRSMSSDLAQLRGAASKIVEKLSSREDNPIYNYVLSIFRDPG